MEGEGVVVIVVGAVAQQIVYSQFEQQICGLFSSLGSQVEDCCLFQYFPLSLKLI